MCFGRGAPAVHAMRDLETIDSDLRLVAFLRRAARDQGGPLPSIDVADALLDERHELIARLQPISCVRARDPLEA